MTTNDNAWSPAYTATLLLEQPLENPITVLVDHIMRRNPQLTVMTAAHQTTLGAMLYPDTCTHGRHGSGVQAHILLIPRAPVQEDELEPSLAHTWRWRDARGSLINTAAALIVSDCWPSRRGCIERMQFFQRTILATLDLLRCAAIHWIPSQQIVDPSVFASIVGRDCAAPTPAIVNVRTFDDPSSDEMACLDTCGLGPIGLWDIECVCSRSRVEEWRDLLIRSGELVYRSEPETVDEAVSLLSRGFNVHADRAPSLIGKESDVIRISQ